MEEMSIEMKERTMYLPESLPQVPGGSVEGDLEVEDKQGHDDGEDSVAEGLEPLLAEHTLHSAVAWKRCR